MATYVKLSAALIMALMAFFTINSPAMVVAVNNDISVAIQEMERANYFTFVMLINMVPPTLFQGNVTFLMPSDRSLSRTSLPQNSVVDLLLNHSIPSPLIFDHLLHLPTNTTLPTSNPDLMLKVSNSAGRRGLFLGNVRVVSPNICTQGDSIRCHGVDGVLSIDVEKPGISCPRVVVASTPITIAAAPLTAPPPVTAPPPYETSSGGGRRDIEIMVLTCMAFVWVLCSN